jgi:hypothetical protein
MSRLDLFDHPLPRHIHYKILKRLFCSVGGERLSSEGDQSVLRPDHRRQLAIPQNAYPARAVAYVPQTTASGGSQRFNIRGGMKPSYFM